MAIWVRNKTFYTNRLILSLKNDIIGPAGYGDARFVPVDVLLSYRIRFENDVNASAPAQRVFIITTLDDDLDIRTLRVGSYGFGNFTQEVANPSGFLQVMKHVK